MERLEQLRVFIAVARSASFTAAAAQLDLPRANVSLAVQQLEARLGTRLLNRTTRSVRPTPDGEALLEHAAALVEDADELDQLFRPQSAGVQGRLRVNVPSRMARRLIAPALPDFLAANPELELELGSSDRTVDLVTEGIDCALRVGIMSSSSLVARSLGHLRLIHCASRAYLARHGTPATPEDLVRHTAVLYAPPGEHRAAAWEWVQDSRVLTRAMTGPVTVNNAESYIACCLAGLGLIQIPAYDVREHLASGDLVEILADWPPPAMPIQLVFAHRRHLSRRVQTFGGWLAGILAPVLV